VDSTDHRDLESAVRNTRRVPLGELAERAAEASAGTSPVAFNSSL
jgi:hypothetical protein